MQRLLSLGTLGVLGGLVWMFLTGGGLENLGQPIDGQPPGNQQGTYTQQGAYSPQRAPAQQPNYPPRTQVAQQQTHQQQPSQYQQPPGQQPAGPSSRPVYAPEVVQQRRPDPPQQGPFSNASVSRTTSQPTTQGGAHPSSVPHAGDGPRIRIASFNIQMFGKSKEQKAEGRVFQTLAEIIRQFDIVAIQEIRTKDTYFIPRFVELINSTGIRYDYVIGKRVGNTSQKEQYAFLFDTRTIETDFQSKYTVHDPDNRLHREPLVANFRTRVNPADAFTFTLVNIHTDPDVAQDEVDTMADVYRAVRREGGNEDDVIVLGDLNVDDRHLGRLGQLPGMFPLIKGKFSNTRHTKLYDNLVIHQPSTTEYTGRSGVFDFMRLFNMTQEQALWVSDHLPVWAEFSAYERDATGQVANRRGMRR